MTPHILIGMLCRYSFRRVIVRDAYNLVPVLLRDSNHLSRTIVANSLKRPPADQTARTRLSAYLDLLQTGLAEPNIAARLVVA